MVPSSFAVPNSKASGFGDLEPFAAMSVSMPATLAASAPVVFSFPRSCGREGGLAAWGSVRSR